MRNGPQNQQRLRESWNSWPNSQTRIPIASEELQLDATGLGQLPQSLGKQQILVASDAVDESGLWPLLTALGQLFQPGNEGGDADTAGNPVVRVCLGWGQREPPEGTLDLRLLPQLQPFT